MNSNSHSLNSKGNEKYHASNIDRTRNQCCIHSETWSPEEDDLLRSSVFKHGGKKWKVVSTSFSDKTPHMCSMRWNLLQNKVECQKRPWTAEEDEIMLRLIKKHGPKKWAVIASYLVNRNGKQCRERWHNQLNPGIRKASWTTDEDKVIISMQKVYGNQWAKIAKYLPGRTDNAVKNRWHSSIKCRDRKELEYRETSHKYKRKLVTKTNRISGRDQVLQYLLKEFDLSNKLFNIKLGKKLRKFVRKIKHSERSTKIHKKKYDNSISKSFASQILVDNGVQFNNTSINNFDFESILAEPYMQTESLTMEYSCKVDSQTLISNDSTWITANEHRFQSFIYKI